MNHSEAIEKAKQTSEEAYAIPADMAQTARSVIGKTLTSKVPGNTNRLTVTEWVKQCYIVQINGSENYSTLPVMYFWQQRSKFNIE